MFKKISGTKDILPAEIAIWQKIESISREIFSLYNYREIRTPLIEDAALFNRTLGESAEIVQKQMFMIHNKDEAYALRPEGTASVVRSYIENNLDKTSGFMKLYYLGPMFRLERPQKGRLRQFHHIGAEAIGSPDAFLDIEVIRLITQLLDGFSITGYTLKLNSLGCSKDKQGLSKTLKNALQANADKLCPDCQNRLNINVLRILDCKNETCREIVNKLQESGKHLCPECLEHFTRVKSGLDSLKINYRLTPHLVRGLDYYNRTVFEITHPGLGAQDAIGAGGRYNNLVKELGGPDLGAIGFAFGVERILLVSKLAQKQPAGPKLVFLITLGDDAKKAGINLLAELRNRGIACDADYEAKSLKGSMRAANDLNSRCVLILGDNELKNKTITVKDMASGQQKEVKIEQLAGELKC